MIYAIGGDSDTTSDEADSRVVTGVPAVQYTGEKSSHASFFLYLTPRGVGRTPTTRTPTTPGTTVPRVWILDPRETVKRGSYNLLRNVQGL